MAGQASSALTFTDLTLGYHHHPAVHHLSGSLEKGTLTALVGANGSGKSTLMKGITSMLRPMTGAIDIAPGQTLAYLPQETELDRHFPARVVDLIALGLWNRRGLIGRHTRADRDRIAEALATVGLTGFDHRPLDTLSGGQLQRALFARVLVQDADLILLDEPFSAIDQKTLSDLLALIHTWHDEQRTIVVVVHDLDLVRAHFPEALLMARSVIAWGPTPEVLSARNLLKARNFRETWDETAPWCAADDDDVSELHVDHGHGAASDRAAGGAA